MRGRPTARPRPRAFRRARQQQDRGLSRFHNIDSASGGQGRRGSPQARAGSGYITAKAFCERRLLLAAVRQTARLVSRFDDEVVATEPLDGEDSRPPGSRLDGSRQRRPPPSSSGFAASAICKLRGGGRKTRAGVGLRVKSPVFRRFGTPDGAGCDTAVKPSHRRARPVVRAVIVDDRESWAAVRAVR